MNELYSTFGALLVAGLIAWGALRSKVSTHEKELDQLRAQNEEQRAMIMETHEKFVSYAHFNEVLGTIKENHRDLKDDIKRVFELISGDKK